MEAFRNDPACKVFLSTDAGGVGLNLQASSAVINFEPPWNPARLEQRIGRVHRLGQSRPVQVIHFLTSGSIEERVWETLRLKKSLFAGVFDSPAVEVSFSALGKKSVLQAVKEVFADQPGRPKPVVEAPPPAPLPAGGQLDRRRRSFSGIAFLASWCGSLFPASGRTVEAPDLASDPDGSANEPAGSIHPPARLRRSGAAGCGPFRLVGRTGGRQARIGAIRWRRFSRRGEDRTTGGEGGIRTLPPP
jgi:hypothetical protein